jgi:glycine cleavage system H protein
MGYMDSQKINLEIIAPVNGTVVQINHEFFALSELSDTYVRNINIDPYGKGWLMVVQLSNLDELQELLKPEGYATLIVK